jgi:uncharacterized secreted protein with C-terminal beta-propeller domain
MFSMNETTNNQIAPQEASPKKHNPPHIRKFINHLALLLVFVMFSIILGYMTATFFCKDKDFDFSTLYTDLIKPKDPSKFSFQKFTSEEEFKNFIAESEQFGANFFGGAAMQPMLLEDASLERAAPGGDFVTFGNAGGAPERTSGTNIQVSGVDEPDIVKATGKTIFTSFRGSYIRPLPLEEPGIGVRPTPLLLEEDDVIEVDSDMIDPRTESIVQQELVPSPPPPPEINREDLTKVINAFPPEDLEVIGGMEEMGNLLYSEDVLTIFTNDSVIGYDVSDIENPSKKWQIKYEKGSSYKDARLNDGKIYLVMQTYHYGKPTCPITPVMYKNAELNIRCTDIYHPVQPVSSDSTFTVFKIDPKDGEIEDDLTFVGSQQHSIIYMSSDNLYVTYSFAEDYVQILSGFILEDGSDLFSEEFKNKILKLNSYDLSQTTKTMEFMTLLQEYLSTQDPDDSLKLETDFQDRFEKYSKSRLRDFTTTGIVKIDKDDLEIDSTGEVPGNPLNQFSLDEFKGNLRIATNVGQNLGFGSMGDENDVYILDKNLNIVGSVQGMGVDERIYSARFIGDEGYIVTFRETDPFYVLDLSDPSSPELKGELKIPGYSSYLHPLEDDLILGVGKEGSKVKLSLFDVSDPDDPTEVDKYMLDEFWSGILDTHHAFLQDERFKAFFIPGSKGGYIFSYSGNELDLEKTDRTTNVQRAVYMDDYLYIISTDQITVLNERTWEEVKEFDL